MAEIVFQQLRQLGAIVDVRRVDADGGFALADLDGVQVSVDVYFDPTAAGTDRVLLMRESGEYLLVEPDDVEDAIIKHWGIE